jgi:hypothetical protein
MHQRLQQSVQGRPTQRDAFEQLGGAQFVLVDRERFQNVQSPFNGPDAISTAGTHENPSKPCVTRVYRRVRLMDKIIILRTAAQLGMTVKVTYSSQGEAFS